MSKPEWGARDWKEKDLVVSDDCFNSKKYRNYIVEIKTQNKTVGQALSTSKNCNSDKEICNHEKSKKGTRYTGVRMELDEDRTAKAWW